MEKPSHFSIFRFKADISCQLGQVLYLIWIFFTTFPPVFMQKGELIENLSFINSSLCRFFTKLWFSQDILTFYKVESKFNAQWAYFSLNIQWCCDFYFKVCLCCVWLMWFCRCGRGKQYKTVFWWKVFLSQGGLDSVYKHKKMRCNYKGNGLVGAAQNKERNTTEGELPKTKMKKTKKWK